MFIYFIVSLLFELMRSLFFAYIVRRLTRNDMYGLFTLMFYYAYLIVETLFPVFLHMEFILYVILLLISLLIYSYLFKVFQFKFTSKLKSVSLDIYTITYEHFILYGLTSLFLISFILFQFIGRPFDPLLFITMISVLALYIVFIKKRDFKATSHIIIRIGKDHYTYQMKPIDLRLKKVSYHDFFKSEIYQLDLIAKVIYRKDKLLRYDYIYALKSSVSTCFDGFQINDVLYQETLDALKHYQLVKIQIKDNSTSIKRIK
jgi:hypothetical protein